MAVKTYRCSMSLSLYDSTFVPICLLFFGNFPYMIFFSLEILPLKGGEELQEFNCKTKILSGDGALTWLEGCKCESLLLVTDPYFMENGWAERIAGLVTAEKRTFFHHIKPDPTVELAAEGTAIMRQTKPDLLIALGGGSAMDTTKAMRYFAGEHEVFVAIPTTSGSGSEVTDFSILTHSGVKHPLIDKRMQPDVAILAKELVEKLPPSLVADGGFDVLSHAMESFVAENTTPMTQALAGNAFATVFDRLTASFRGDQRAREEVHLASCMAGLAFSQSGLGMCHALSHALGGVFHLPHGRLNAILLPQIVTANTVAAGREYAKLARMAGLGGSGDTMAVRNLKNALIRLRKELQLPGSLQEAGISPQKVRQHRAQIVEAALKDPCMDTNPVKADAFVMGSILDAVTGHG